MLVRPANPSPALPAPSGEARAASQALCELIAEEIRIAGGRIGFDRFMELALYAPGLGYYSGGAHKLGAAGDFITAPEMSPLFAQTLAAQVAQCVDLAGKPVIEAGAGSGKLAANLLQELAQCDALPPSYGIIEISGELRARQQQTIARLVPHLAARVCWLDQLPAKFSGLVLANEVLDAMPVQLVVWHGQRIDERGVGLANGRFCWSDRPAGGRLRQRAQELSARNELHDGYLSEICLRAGLWVSEWASILEHGVLLLIDYGFPEHEYYHPQRASGTLMCHYRQHAHADPFYLPGLNDITAHVDFSAIAEAACSAGFDLLGYTTQASFLFNCGLTEILARTPASDPLRYLPLASTAQKLVSPAEMGELYKVIALGKGIRHPLRGFTSGDRSHTL